jgi:hypothetical protein
MDKISFVHPIYTPINPYLSIGMDYLIAFHAFTFFLGDGGAKPAFFCLLSPVLSHERKQHLYHHEFQ